MITLSKDESLKLSKKLEHSFKKKNPELVESLQTVKTTKKLSDEDIKLIFKKLEYKFKKSEDELLLKLKAEYEKLTTTA